MNTKPNKHKGMAAVELMVLLAIGFLLFAIFFAGCRQVFGGFSSGSRVGTISKFSYRGLFVKSWEGEMVLGGTVSNSDGAAVANVWQFSVTDPAVVSKVQAAADSGARVKLTYKQGGIAPMTRETTYVVTDATKIQ